MNSKQLYEEYEPDNSIWSEEDEYIKKVKFVVFNRLTESEKRIIICYAELQSLRKLGKLLGISTASACITVQKIRAKIQNNL